MADNTSRKRRGPSDATDYSSTQAPETRRVAEGRHPLPTDDRLVPGGPAGSDAESGVASLDRDKTPSRAEPTGETDTGSTGALDEG